MTRVKTELTPEKIVELGYNIRDAICKEPGCIPFYVLNDSGETRFLKFIARDGRAVAFWLQGRL